VNRVRSVVLSGQIGEITLGIGVEHAECGVAALDRHAQGLPDGEVDDGTRGFEAAVGGGVGGDHTLTCEADVIDDGAGDGEPLIGWWGMPPPDGLGLQLAPSVLQEQGGAVGTDRLEDQLQDPGEQLFDIVDVADGLGGPVHDRQMGQPRLEPLPGRAGGLEQGIGAGRD
jgi:hypothetical protein